MGILETVTVTQAVPGQVTAVQTIASSVLLPPLPLSSTITAPAGSGDHRGRLWEAPTLRKGSEYIFNPWRHDIFLVPWKLQIMSIYPQGVPEKRGSEKTMS